jgi:hypothetical protein
VRLAELTPESFPLPTAGAVLRRLARAVTGGAGFALLHGVPVDGDPDLVCGGVGSYAGTIVPQGAEGLPVQHVRDQAADPGDMQFLNNHVILHRRTEYEDHPEPERRRDLVRLWLDASTTPLTRTSHGDPGPAELRRGCPF